MKPDCRIFNVTVSATLPYERCLAVLDIVILVNEFTKKGFMRCSFGGMQWPSPRKKSTETFICYLKIRNGRFSRRWGIYMVLVREPLFLSPLDYPSVCCWTVLPCFQPPNHHKDKSLFCPLLCHQYLELYLPHRRRLINIHLMEGTDPKINHSLNSKLRISEQGICEQVF